MHRHTPQTHKHDAVQQSSSMNKRKFADDDDDDVLAVT